MRTFDFETLPVRVLERDSGYWFVAADVCRVLELANPRQVISRLDEDEKGVHNMDTLGGEQQMSVINESGLYGLILTSRKAAARRFRKWVTSEVLIALRRDGRYEMAESGEDEADGAETELKLFGLPLAKVNAAAKMIALARSIGGIDAARALWLSDPTLPPLPFAAGMVAKGMLPGLVPTDEFFDERIRVTGNACDRMTSTQVYVLYRQWLAERGLPVPNMTVFGRHLHATALRRGLLRRRHSAGQSLFGVAPVTTH